MEKKKVLSMVNVTKRFPGVTALKDVCIDLYEGEILGIVGENGAGKSTLMKILSGSYACRQYEGEIYIDGIKKEFKTITDAQKAGIEMVYQELNVCLDLSVAENLFLGNMKYRNGLVDWNSMYEEAAKLMDRVTLHNIDPKINARFLNSGQLQLISILKAYIKNPKILIMDEPSSALTEQEVDILMNLLEEIKKEGVAIIYISHKLDEIYRLCDRVTVIRDGNVVDSKITAEYGKERMIENMVGRKVENLYPKDYVEIGEEVFKVEHLTVPHPNIHGKNIIEDISFSLRKGEILGIGGLVGAGRSEAMGAVYGQYSNGVKKEVYIHGQKVEINKPEDAIKNRIGFVTEERKLNGVLLMSSIKDNISLASLDKISNYGFINAKMEEEIISRQFDALRIKAPSTKTLVNQLSGGNQQKVILAKWLVNDPDILIIDEPTKGIDVGTKADFYKIMNELTKKGVSIIMISSDMPELISMSDRVLVFAGSRITAELTGDQITEINVMNAAIDE